MKAERVRHLSFDEKKKLCLSSRTSVKVLTALAGDRDVRVLRIVAVRTDLPSEIYVQLSKRPDEKVQEVLAQNRSLSIHDEVWFNLSDSKHSTVLGLLEVNPNMPSAVLRKLYVKKGNPSTVKALLWKAVMLEEFKVEFWNIYRMLFDMDVSKRQTLFEVVKQTDEGFAHSLLMNAYRDGSLLREIFCLLTGDDGESLPQGWVEHTVESMLVNPSMELLKP